MRQFNKYSKKLTEQEQTKFTDASVTVDFWEKQQIGMETGDVYLYSIEFDTEGEYLNCIESLKSAKT